MCVCDEKRRGDLVSTMHYLKGDNARLSYRPDGNLGLGYYNELPNGTRYTKELLVVKGLKDFVANIRQRYHDLTSSIL